MRTGTWQLLAAAGWPDNQSCRDLLTWSWTPGDGQADPGQAGDVRGHVVVVNLAATAAQARIPLPWPGLPGRRWSLLDLLTAEEFSRDGDELADPGLYVDLRPGQCYLLAVRRPGDADPGDADPADG